MVGRAAGRGRSGAVTAGVHLVGGGWGGDARVWRAFLAEAAVRRDVPRIAVVSVRDRDEQEHAATLIAAVRGAGQFEPHVIAVQEGATIAPDAFPDDLDGVLIGGGLTPAYREAVLPSAERIRGLVAAGRPYAGFSAGSAIAASRALLGGWRAPAGHPVVDEDVAEGLEGLAVQGGLGLVPFSVDVHAAQWGTLNRLITAVEVGLAPEGVAIDEDTAVLVREGAVEVVGTGNAWWVTPAAADGVHVRREASSSNRDR
jgi:cyanophycinase